jgi:exopolyphosphatase / guanosine-5'-triphosphate,3'-diphosphate pyrophosphatase
MNRTGTDGRRAAVDVGSNSVRVIVLDEGGTVLAREMEITRLGRGVDERGVLDDDALERTLDVIGRYRRTWEEHGAEEVRIAATSAIRDADDRHRFFAGVREVTGGLDAHVLSGEQEARTAFLGAVSAVDVPHPVLVLDVGGGSTEVIVGDDAGRLAGSVSLQLGCVRLSERLLRSDPPQEEELRAARREADAQLERGAVELARRDADPEACASLVGVAGTVTTLAALHLGLDAYEPDRIHGTRVPRDVVRELTAWLASMSSEERARLGPMAPGREDVIVAGAVVVEAALGRFGADELVASESDILDGLALADEHPGRG